MRWSSDRLPLVVFGVFLLYAFGVLIDADSLTRQAGIAAAVALVAYAGLARVGWPLLIGVAAVAVAVYFTLPAPANVSGLRFLSLDDVEQLNQFWQRGVTRTRWIGLALLLGAAGGLVAVLALPHRRRRWALPVAIVPALLAIGSAVNSLVGSAQRSVDRGGDLVAAVWLPVLAALVAFALAVLSTQRGTRGWQSAFAALGAMMLAIVALGYAVQVGVAMPSLRHAGSDFLILGSLVYTGSRMQVEDAMTALATLAGPLLIVLAARRPPSGTP